MFCLRISFQKGWCKTFLPVVDFTSSDDTEINYILYTDMQSTSYLQPFFKQPFGQGENGKLLSFFGLTLDLESSQCVIYWGNLFLKEFHHIFTNYGSIQNIRCLDYCNTIMYNQVARPLVDSRAMWQPLQQIWQGLSFVDMIFVNL